jgi:hypothetical protein
MTRRLCKYVSELLERVTETSEDDAIVIGRGRSWNRWYAGRTNREERVAGRRKR